MKEIIPPVEKALIKKELNKQNFLRPTNKAGNEIYDITAHEAPNVMREITRLRELSYRDGGGSTGEEMDIDSMDTMEVPYHQLIVWDPENEEIVGGYRYLWLRDCTFDKKGQPFITSAHLFRYTEYFIKKYLPVTIELGRAFVQPKYQTREMGMKALFALDNLWDGLGAVMYNHPEVKYLIGKVTIYPNYDEVARDLIYAYLRRFCFDRKELFMPYKPIDISCEAQEMADDLFEGDDAKENFHLLMKAIRARGTTIPPMFSAYLNLTPKLRFFGNAVNDELSNVYETGIMVKMDDVYEDKRVRYIGAYIDYISNYLTARRNRNRLLRKEREEREEREKMKLEQEKMAAKKHAKEKAKAQAQ